MPQSGCRSGEFLHIILFIFNNNLNPFQDEAEILAKMVPNQMRRLKPKVAKDLGTNILQQILEARKKDAEEDDDE